MRSVIGRYRAQQSIVGAALLCWLAGCAGAARSCPTLQTGRFKPPRCEYTGRFFPTDPGTARWHFIDLGAGESIVLESDGRLMVVDGGLARERLTTYLGRSGLFAHRVETLVLTHADSDHHRGVGGLLEALAEDDRAIGEFWDSGYDGDGAAGNCTVSGAYRAVLAAARTRVENPAGFMRPLRDHHPERTTFPWAGDPQVRIQVLHAEPNPTTVNPARGVIGGHCAYKRNNASIVMKVQVDGYAVLLAGDANGKLKPSKASEPAIDVERKLVDMHNAGMIDLRADVLKVPHHGSESASTAEFIEAVDPDYVIFVGDGVPLVDVPFLPRESVVERYDNGRRQILRTDRTQMRGHDHIGCGTRAGRLHCGYMPAHRVPK